MKVYWPAQQPPADEISFDRLSELSQACVVSVLQSPKVKVAMSGISIADIVCLRPRDVFVICCLIGYRCRSLKMVVVFVS
jgi:hypothetical protein